MIHTYAPGEAEKLDAADMAKQEEAWEASGHNDLFALLWALTYCQQALPPWINHAVRELIDRRLDAGLWTQDQIDSMRWACACDEIKKRGWTGAFERVSNRLANTPALANTPVAAGRKAMEWSYNNVQKRLGPDRRKRR